MQRQAPRLSPLRFFGGVAGDETKGGWARSANFVPHQHFSDSARVILEVSNLWIFQ